MKNILNECRRLAEYGELPVYETGLCPNLKVIDESLPADFFDFTQWPEFSGNPDYPVPHEFFFPDDAYGILELWDESLVTDPADLEYIAARRRLCAWVADQIESALNDSK